jgi:MFS family permease
VAITGRNYAMLRRTIGSGGRRFLLTANGAGGIRILANVFAPFAAGYFLSYFFRMVNGPLASNLVAEFGLDAQQLGLLTSIYFLTFAALQLPLGALIDRYGPRRVQCALMAVAAAGAALFGVAHDIRALMIGRALIGIGFSGSLMTGLKALVLWVPKERLPLLNGYFIMFGGLGATAATGPVDMALHVVDWRGIFFVLAMLTAVIALLVLVLVPESKNAGPAASWRSICAGIVGAYRDPVFWRLAPVSAAAVATAWSVQGLWAARWFSDVDGLDGGAIDSRLLVMALSLTVGAPVIGAVGGAVRRLHVSSATLFALACTVFICVQIAVIDRLAVSSFILWGAFAMFGSMTVLSYSMLAEHFVEQRIARANAALNVLHIGAAFAVQYAMGAVTSGWPADASGQYPVAAYQAAFALPLAVQIAALIWFIWAPRLPAIAAARRGDRSRHEHIAAPPALPSPAMGEDA